MAQHNCGDQEPTDDPSTVPTTSQASCDHPLKPKCAHNPLVTQCNQSQYLTLIKKNGVHSSSTSQASQTNLSNSLVSQYTPDPGEHVLKGSLTSTSEQDIPVQWFKFIHPSPKPRMTKTPFSVPSSSAETNRVSNCNSRLVTKNLTDHAGRNGEHSCVPFNPNNTSCGFMLKEVDLGGKHPFNSVVDWQSHETYPTGHNISEVDWESLHDSRLFLFLVNIDYDAKPKVFFTQELWGELPERISSTTVRSLKHVEGKLVHHLELQKDPIRLDHQLDQQRDPTSSPYPDMCPNPSLSLTITLLLVGHYYYLLKKMGRDLTSTSLMVYLKYSFDTEEGFSNYISIKQYRSPYNLPDLGQHEIYLTNGILGRNLCSLNSSGQLHQLRSVTSNGFNLNTTSVAC